MKEHFCPVEQSVITYQGECGWCGEKEALAQTQEPVAWTLLMTGEHAGMVGKAGEKFEGAPDYYQRIDVYTTPPQRSESPGKPSAWVGLTDEEIDVIDEATWQNSWGINDFARAIEAKLREKNSQHKEKNKQ